jgi:hypothetical protein
MRTATIAAVSASAVTISIAGGQIASGVGVLGSYVPVVGDTVAVFRQDSSWLILGEVSTVGGGRSWVAGGGLSGSSGAVGASETTVFGLSNYTYQAGRAYYMVCTGMISVSVAANKPLLRLRKTDPSGQEVLVTSIYCPVTGQLQGGWGGVFIVGGTSVSATLAFTIVGGAAFNVNTTNVYSCNVYYIGSSAPHAGYANTLV